MTKIKILALAIASFLLLAFSIASLLLSGSANAQTPAGPTSTMTSTLTTNTTNNAPSSRSVAVTVTASDPAGLKSISIMLDGTQKASCPTSPCSATIPWNVTATTGPAHVVSSAAQMTQDGQTLTNQVSYPY